MSRSYDYKIQKNDLAFLVDQFMDIITVSRRLEAARMDLACRTDFNLLEAFAIFDTDGKGFCTYDEFHNKFWNIAPEKNPTLGEV